MTDPKSEPSERILPKGEVMARGVINGLPVELIRYTEAEIRARDRQWQYEVDRERDTARSQRCHRMNLELDLRRLLDGEPTICDFEIVEELRAALTPAPAQPAPNYVSRVTECEACLTEDACRIRGQCGHYLRERDAQPGPPTAAGALTDAQCDAIQNALETALAAREYVTLIEGRALIRAAAAGGT